MQDLIIVVGPHRSLLSPGPLVTNKQTTASKLEAELVNLVEKKAELLKGIYCVCSVNRPTHSQQNGVRSDYQG